MVVEIIHSGENITREEKLINTVGFSPKFNTLCIFVVVVVVAGHQSVRFI